ncbi:MAG TPA: hydroxypyruvate isomerase [Devosiaceae bacterium]|jgi:hydroxypyruvate isomerase
MLKFNPNITLLYTEHAFMDRFAAAAADGFKGVEYRGPYDYPKEAIAEQLQQHGLKQVLFNFPAGNWNAGERGIACLPGRQEEFREGLKTAIEYADALDCKQLNCLAGIAPASVAHEAVEATLVENLRYAADRLADLGIKLQLEAINFIDNPGCFVSSTNHFERIHELVGSDNLYLQYDFYHLQVMQGDLIRNFQRLQPLIAHVQIADNPGRHEPGTGEINYDFILSELERLDYQGWVGCEYVPKGKTSDGLGWFRARAER